MPDDFADVDLQAVLKYWIRRVWLALILAIVVAVLAGYHAHRHPSYSSRAVLMYQPANGHPALNGFDVMDLTDLARSGAVLARVREEYARRFPPAFPNLRAELTPRKRLVLTAQGRDPKATAQTLEIWIRMIREEFETGMKTNPARVKTTQATTLTKTVPETIRILIKPSESSNPTRSPIRYGLTAGILVFGFLTVILLLAAALRQGKPTRVAL